MKKWITAVKLAGLIIGEVIIIGLPVAALSFWICYLGDIWWGDHLLIKNADRCFTICNILGLLCGIGFTFYTTRRAYRTAVGINKASNQEVK